MTILSLDTETQGLNTQNFLMGCLYDGERALSFRSKKKLWAYLVQHMEEHRKKKKTLFIYAHNMHYDFLTIKPEPLPHNFEIYCHNPFIVDVKDQEGRIYAKFLSTTSLYRGPLAAMGKDMGYEKHETPEWLKKDNYEPDFAELAEAQRYMERDTIIVHKYMKKLREFLNRKDIRTRWLITAGQIGMNYLLQHIRVDNNAHSFLTSRYWDGEMHPTKHKTNIHEALRGGRTEAYQYGTFENTTQIDINSHYPHILATMDMPDLTTETMHRNVTEKQFNKHLKKIGISRVTITTAKHDYGILPIRTDDGDSYYPKTEGIRMVGAWTHAELNKALQAGYQIEHIFWTLTWETTTNPLTKTIEMLSKQRLETEDDLQKHFLKMLMNSAIGKFAQRRAEREYTWIESGYKEELELQEKGYHAVEEDGYWRLYMKEKGYNYPKFYAPIINAQLTALGRLKMLEVLERLPASSVYYCDTDGLVADTEAIKKANFKYDQSLGGMKLEHDSKTALIYGRKSIMIGEEVRLSGIPKTWVNTENFRAGRVPYKRMRTAGNTHDSTLIGTFATYERNLLRSAAEARTKQAERAEQKLFIDALDSDQSQWKGIGTGTP